MTSLYGSTFDCRKYAKYMKKVSWDEHSVYKGYRIERAYMLNDEGEFKVKNLYRSVISDDKLIVGSTLEDIRRAITEYKLAQEGPAWSN